MSLETLTFHVTEQLCGLYLFVCVLKKIGLASNIKIPSHKQIEKLRISFQK